MPMAIRFRALLPGVPPELGTAGADLRRAVAASVAKYALLTQTGAKQRAPIETGRLRQSITVVFPVNRRGLAATIGTNVRSPRGYAYPARQEFDETLQHSPPVVHKHRGGGTKQGYTTTIGRRGGEWGYLRKALAEQQPRFARAVLQDLQTVLQRAFRSGSGA